MKNNIIKAVASVLLVASGSTLAAQEPAAASKPMTLVDSLSVNYGRMFASGLLETMKQMAEQDELKLNKELLFDAFCSTFKSGEAGDVRAMQNEVIGQFNRATDEIKRNSPEAKANEAAEAEFIAKLKKNKKVIFTESGLAYTIDVKGTGKTFAESKSIDTKYVGKHLDGSVFDKSETPVAMDPNRMIKGFGEGLRLMSPGAKFTLYIPARLAYGINGGGRGIIKRNEMLIFEVETVGETPERKPALQPVQTPDEKSAK